MTTHSKNHISKPKSFTDGTVRYPLPRALLVDGIDVAFFAEPTCYTSAIKDLKWRAAMNLKFDALLKNQTLDIVPSRLAQNIIGCKWVFQIKRHVDGSIERYKARLVAKGFHQVSSGNYGETVNPVIKPTTKRYILDLLGKTRMLEAKPLSSPMVSSTNLYAFEKDPLPDATLYRSTLSLTCPDINFTVNKLSQFRNRPTTIHWQAVKRLLR